MSTASGGSAGFVVLPGTGATRGRGLARDDRPEPLGWSPAIPLGVSGWRQSSEPFCDTSQNPVTSLGIWASERGVFVSMTAQCKNDWCEDGGFALQFNDGSGWQVSITDTTQSPAYPSTNRLSGLPESSAILIGYTPIDFAPYRTAPDSVILFGKSGALVQPRLSAQPGSAAVAAFGVGPEHAYVLVEENTERATSSVHEYKSGTWHKLATLPTQALAIWADDETVLVAGAHEGVYRRLQADPEFELLPNVPEGDYVSVWSFAHDDVWVGRADGQLAHFDGTLWNVFTTGTEQPIQRLWGADRRIFYISTTEFGRADEGGVEPLVRDGAGLRFWDLWGRAADEVFLTVTEPTLAAFRCGEKRALWYDGVAFHRF
jgi:hypothetical protein